MKVRPARASLRLRHPIILEWFWAFLGSWSSWRFVGGSLPELEGNSSFFVLFHGIIWVGYLFGYDVSGALGVILFRGCCARLWLLCKGVMEWQFLVEAKSFVFLVSEGGVDPAGRKKGFASVVFLGLQCTVWLVGMVEVVLWNTGAQDFVKSFQVGQQVLIVCQGGNRASHFLWPERAHFIT